MSVYYLDTSALVKLYVREPGTDKMLRLANSSNGNTLAILALTRLEFRAAVRQRVRTRDITLDIAEQLLVRMDGHMSGIYVVQPLTELVVDEAAALLDRHALRAYDALQLAGYLLLRASLREQAIFVCSDRQLLKAAEDDGMPVLDPAVESHVSH